MPESAVQQLLAGLWSLGSFLVAIIILVAVHEWGHFWVARQVGVKILRFSIGFGKPLLTWCDRYGTEFVVAAIPVGGYVKMLDEREGEVSEQDSPFSFNRQTVWRRALIVAAGPVANFILALLTYWVLFSGGESGLVPLVGQVKPDSVAAKAGLLVGQEIVAVDGLSTPTRDAVYSALVARLGDSGELALTVKRPESDIGYELIVDLRRWLSESEQPDPLESLGFSFFAPPFVEIFGVVPGSVAERAGLRKGDIVEKVNDQRVTGPREWVDAIRAKPDQAMEFSVRRKDSVMAVWVTPASVLDKDGRAIGQIGAQVGHTAMPAEMSRHITHTPLQAAHRAVEETSRQARLLVQSLHKLIVGDLSPKNLSGPLGIAKVAGTSAGMGLSVFAQTLAVLSISLGVMNLLPVPMLDGGHLMLYLVEAIKGSPVPESVQVIGNQVGMALLAVLMIFAMYNDILKL